MISAMVLLVTSSVFKLRKSVPRLRGRQYVGRLRLLVAWAFASAALLLIPPTALASPAIARCQNTTTANGPLAANPSRCLGTVPFAAHAEAEARFTQLNWLSDEGTVLVPNSRVGVVEFSFSDADSELLEEEKAVGVGPILGEFSVGDS